VSQDASRELRRHPCGPACSDNEHGLYFNAVSVSEEYRRRQKSGKPFTKAEVGAVARVAVQIAVRLGDLPEEAHQVEIEVCDVSDCDRYFIGDYVVLVWSDEVDLRGRVAEVVEDGLSAINGHWLAQQPEGGEAWDFVAFFVDDGPQEVVWPISLKDSVNPYMSVVPMSFNPCFDSRTTSVMYGLTPEALAACARLSPALRGPERLCVASWPDGVLAIVPEQPSVEMLLGAYADGWFLDRMREARVPPWRMDNVAMRETHNG
jgi:hypothetical protein